MNGLAKLAVTTLPAGADVITATYSASANVAGSSASMVQNVE
jgi:glyoxylate carboligase